MSRRAHLARPLVGFAVVTALYVAVVLVVRSHRPPQPATPPSAPVAAAASPYTAPASRPAGRPSPATRAAAASDAVAELRKAATRYLLAARHDDVLLWEPTPAPIAANDGFSGRRWGVLSAVVATAVQDQLRPAGDRAARADVRARLTAIPLSLDGRARAARLIAVHGLPREGKPGTLQWDGPVTRWCNELARPLYAPYAVANAKAIVVPPADAETHLVALQSLLDETAANSPIEVPSILRANVDAYWRSVQRPDGSWAAPGGASVADDARVTALAVALLLTVRDPAYLLKPADDASVDDPAIARALAWLDARDPKDLLRVDVLAALERAAYCAGRRRFGGFDLEADGVAYLRGIRNPDGSFGSAADPDQRLYDTALAATFLNRIDVPVMFGKLRYGAGDHRRPHDVANLTGRVGSDLCFGALARWRHVSADDPDFAARCDAPVLIVAGRAAPKLDPAGLDRLRAYVEAGGLIVGGAEDGQVAFSKGFQDLGQALFPNAVWRELPDDSPVFGLYKAKMFAGKTRVLGLSNGVRELMVCATGGDPGKAWQNRSAAQGRWAFQLGADFWLYPLKEDGARWDFDSRQRAAVGAVPVSLPAGTLRVALLSNPGQLPPEPAAWRRMATHLASTDGLIVEPTVVPITDPALAALDPKQVPLAHWTGTRAVPLTPPQRQAIAKYVRGGGTLLVDAAGGSKPFADSAEADLAMTFGDAGQPIPITDPFYAAVGTPIARARWRVWGPDADVGGDAYGSAPHVRAIRVDGRPAVLFSREDLTAGMAGLGHDGILGYRIETATEIARHAALLAARR